MGLLTETDPFSKLSKKQREEEWLKCKLDPAYFIRKYCKVKHPTKQLLPFELYPFQEELLGEFRQNSYNLYIKSRQLGISTLVACYSVWMSMFFKHQSILILATKRDVAKNLLQKVKLAYEHLPNFFKKQRKIDENNSTTFKLDNGSEIKCVGTTKDAVRSEALSLMIIDEAAFIEEMDEIWTAAQPALSGGGKCIALSSPNGEGDWFHEQFILSSQGDGIFSCRELMWYLHPDRIGNDWEAKTRKALVTAEKFAQEYECSFLASGRTVIEPAVIKRLEEHVKSPSYMTGLDNALWVWEEYKENKNYLISVDVCKGDKTDFSVAEVWKVGVHLEQVAELRTKMLTDEFGEELYKLCKLYGSPLTAVESNSYGTAVLNVLKQKKYKNIFYSNKKWENFEPYNQHKDYSKDSNYEIGIFTAQKSKDLIIDKLQDCTTSSRVVIRSSRLMREIKTFIWTQDRKAKASGKNNDDTVMASAFACWIFETVLEKGEAKTKDYVDLFQYASRLSSQVSAGKPYVQDIDLTLRKYINQNNNAAQYSKLKKYFF